MRLYLSTINFFKELHKRNAIFFYLTVVLTSLALFVSFHVCSNPLGQICHWLKPGKFAYSFALYVATLGWFMEYLKSGLGEKRIRFISSLIAILVSLEMINMLFQSWLDTDGSSLLKLSSAMADSISNMLYHLTNVIIVINVGIATFVGVQFFRPLSLKPEAYLWGIRAGFAVFIFSGFLGAFLVAKYGQVPIDDTRYGLPFTHFSTLRDNLISLHFLGIHSLQLLPLCCYGFQKYLSKWFTVSVSSLYMVICLTCIIAAS